MIDASIPLKVDTSTPLKLAELLSPGNILAARLRNAQLQKMRFDLQEAQRRSQALDQLPGLLRQGIVETPTTQTVTKPGYQLGDQIYDTPEEALKSAGFDPNGTMTRGLGPMTANAVFSADKNGNLSTAPTDTAFLPTNEVTPPMQNGRYIPQPQEIMRDFQVPGEPTKSIDMQKMLTAALSTNDPYALQAAMPILQNAERVSALADTAQMEQDARNALKSSGGDPTQAIKSLLNVGNWKAAVALQNAMSKAQGGDPTAQVKNWQFYNALPPNQREEFVRMMGTPVRIDTGTSVGLYDRFGNPVGMPMQKSVPPEQTPEIKGQQEAAKTQAELATKKKFEQPAATAAQNALEDKVANLNTKIDQAIDQASGFTTGFMGAMTSPIPGTPAHDLSKTLDTIRAQLGFKELHDMRMQSPTGGALGQISDREEVLLQAAWDSVAQSQSKAQFIANLQNLKRVNARALQRAEQAYSETFGRPYSGSPMQPSVPTQKVAPQGFDSMPDPRQYKGKIIKDQDTGIRYQSDGTSWKRVK